MENGTSTTYRKTILINPQNGEPPFDPTEPKPRPVPAMSPLRTAAELAKSSYFTEENALETQIQWITVKRKQKGEPDCKPRMDTHRD